MYTIHEFSDTEKNLYDGFIALHGAWSFFQSWDWGAVQQSLSAAPIRIGIYNKDALVAVAQLFFIRAKRGSFVHVRQGPVIVAGYETDILLWKELLNFCKEDSRLKGALFIRVNPMVIETDELHELFAKLSLRPSPIHAMDAQVCWVLDLSPQTETLLAQMRKTTRYLIRQAQKLNVRIEQSQDIKAFLDLYKQTSSRHGFVQHHGVSEEYAYFAQRSAAKLYLGYDNTTLISGALIIYFGQQAIYHHGASIQSKVPVSYLLQWQAIQDAKARGCSIYNFWGIAPEHAPNHPWAGLTLFKQGFGGQMHTFSRAYDRALSPLYILPYTVDTVRKWKKGY